MEEAATIARTPRTCFEIWSGDHRQTPGGLQQTEEAKKFRRKLLKRPLALRCPTQYIQPHGLADVVARYLEGHPVFCKQRPSHVQGDQIWADLVGQGEVKVSTQVQKAAVVILWLAMPGNEVANARSTTFAEAAGLDGKQKWGGSFPVVPRRSLEFATLRWCFPALQDTPLVDLFHLMRIYVAASCLSFGMYPGLTCMLLWMVDWLQLQFKFFRDAKSSLAVLHDQNDMVTHFKASSWVSEAQGAVVSRGVTTCAGMTAHTVIVAQTKIGFLTGGRRASFLELPQDEQDIQLEEASQTL